MNIISDQQEGIGQRHQVQVDFRNFRNAKPRGKPQGWRSRRGRGRGRGSHQKRTHTGWGNVETQIQQGGQGWGNSQNNAPTQRRGWGGNVQRNKFQQRGRRRGGGWQNPGFHQQQKPVFQQNSPPGRGWSQQLSNIGNQQSIASHPAMSQPVQTTGPVIHSGGFPATNSPIFMQQQQQLPVNVFPTPNYGIQPQIYQPMNLLSQIFQPGPNKPKYPPVKQLTIKKCDPKKKDFQDVEKQFLLKFTAKPKVISISRILYPPNHQNVKNFNAYQQALVKVPRFGSAGSGNTLRRFHGTSYKCTLGTTTMQPCANATCFVCLILKSCMFKKAVGAGHGLGNGMYFSSNAQCSNGYCRGNAAGEKGMFIVKVCAGLVKKYTTSQPKLTQPEAGYHASVWDYQGGGGDELVVYDTKAALPQFFIVFK